MPESAADIEEFALLLVGDTGSPLELALARAAAASQLELLQVNHERQRLPEDMLANAQTYPNRAANRTAQTKATPTKGLSARAAAIGVDERDAGGPRIGFVLQNSTHAFLLRPHYPRRRNPT
jgi:hypothetical protein